MRRSLAITDELVHIQARNQAKSRIDEDQAKKLREQIKNLERYDNNEDTYQ